MTRIKLKVKPGAKQGSIEKATDGSFVVKVTAPAEGGRANQAVKEALAEYLDIPKSSVTIRHGLTSRNKIIQIG